jgi:hypothetical protein
MFERATAISGASDEKRYHPGARSRSGSLLGALDWDCGGCRDGEKGMG